MRFILSLLLSSLLLFGASNDVAFEEFNEFSKEEPKVFDPLAPYNQAMTTFNDYVYLNIIDPVASGYGTIIPEELRVAISNVFDNLLFPVRFVNNLLQLKFENSADELFRFVINSTLGFAGMGDPAQTHFGIQAHKEDFGQTLGYYGIGNGFHLVLPLLGPSNLRDIVGLSVDVYGNPITYVKTEWDSVGLKAYDRLNSASLHVGEYASIKKDAIDLYPFLRDLYESRRKVQIKE